MAIDKGRGKTMPGWAQGDGLLSASRAAQMRIDAARVIVHSGRYPADMALRRSADVRAMPRQRSIAARHARYVRQRRQMRIAARYAGKILMRVYRQHACQRRQNGIC